jgi:glutamate-1-semialdehyde 2,1-aminomutase
MGTASDALREKARRYLPGGTLGNFTGEVILSRGSGSRVWDADDREYIDYVLGSGPMLLGHSHPDVVQAVREQLAAGTTFFAINERAILLAEEIVAAMPSAEKVRFTSTGTEATLYALRVARAATGREKILKFEGAYHGMHDYSLMSLAPSRASDYPSPIPDSRGIPKSVAESVLVAPFNDLDLATSLIEDHRTDLAAVIVEPLQRILPPLPGFLEGLREATSAHDVVLIFDEIVTGFRLALGGAQAYYGVLPDITTLGKVIAGGFPLAAVAGRERYMAEFDPAQSDEALIQIGTLSGNPVAAAAGLASIEVLKRPGTYERLHAIGNAISSALGSAAAELGIPATIVGDGPVFDLVFTGETVENYADLLAADRQRMARFADSLRAHGVLKDSKFYVSIAHDESDVEVSGIAFSKALADVTH